MGVGRHEERKEGKKVEGVQCEGEKGDEKEKKIERGETMADRFLVVDGDRRELSVKEEEEEVKMTSWFSFLNEM